jgi:adenylate cyclase
VIPRRAKPPSLPVPPTLKTALAFADFAREGLLAGTRGRERVTRAAMLARLAAEGVTVEELHEAVDADRIGMLLLERTLAGPDTYTEAEVAAKAGLDPDFLASFNRAVGLPSAGPDERSYDDHDVELAQRIHDYLELGIPPDGVLAIARTLGLGLGRVAEAVGAILGEALIATGEFDPQLALRYASEARSLGERDAPVVLSRVLSLHLANWIRSQAVSAAQQSGDLAGGQTLAVCFADLVGFTRLGEEIPPDELGRIAESLATTAVAVVDAPVRLVKTIGDAVMLVSPEPDPLLDAALMLVAAVAARTPAMPPLRAGVALGTVIAHSGDWFGPPVNLASRITTAARPGSVVATAAVKAASTQKGLRWYSAGTKRFKGVRDSQQLYTVRRRSTPG